jgi:hypothetical protein
VVYDPNREAPLFFEVSSGNVKDITVAKHKLSRATDSRLAPLDARVKRGHDE